MSACLMETMHWCLDVCYLFKKLVIQHMLEEPDSLIGQLGGVSKRKS